MANRSRFSLWASLSLVLGLVLCLPLQAQLDPKLQGSPTDFLNLFQQSTNLKVKPEVLTIFDFSGSMDALMFHPLYVNTDSADSNASSRISFLLKTYDSHSNEYTVKASAHGGSDSYATYALTVGGTGTAQAAVNGNNRYTMSTISSNLTTFTAGANVTFSASVTTTRSSKQIDWIVTDSSSATVASGTSNSGVSGTPSSFSWSIPGLLPTTGTGVQAQLEGSDVGTLNSSQLIKPNGQVVTASDLTSITATPSLYGIGGASSDIRNWVRAASHVRFSATIGSDSRTIDIPIPWKITNGNSAGNPLSSQTILDQVVKTATDGSTTTYGSGQQIDMDMTWRISSGASVLSSSETSTNNGTSSTQTGTTLIHVVYKKAYIDWLFNGKYTVGTYSGKYIVYDAVNASLAGGQGNASWGQGYGSSAAGNAILVPNYNLDGSYTGTETSNDATVNVVPALTRVQAVKRAAIQTWIQFQGDVIWAFRFLDASGEASAGRATTIDNDSTTTMNVGSPITNYQAGRDSAWKVLNNTSAQGITSTTGNSVTGMTRIASLFASSNTPLTYAVARGLAQFTDPNSVFNSVETGTDVPSQCMNHFLIVFTDGVDNNGTGTNNPNGETPYYIASGSTHRISALEGNHSIIANPSYLDCMDYTYETCPATSWWNLFTFAGVAAHLGDNTLGTVAQDYLSALDPGTTASGAQKPSYFLPYALYKRGSTLFLKPHLITTMTVGVSLGGQFTDATGPKHSLFLAAAVGDPTMPTWSDANTLTPFKWDPLLNDHNGGRVPGSLYFFDATSPDKLSTSLFYALTSIAGASNINVSSTPSTPFIGAALGGEMLVGKFQPPKNGGTLWSGDLMMFGTKLVDNQLKVIDKNGAVTTTVDGTTAQWTAWDALYNGRSWKDRVLFTRLKGTGATPEPGLSTFSDIGTAYTDATTGLKNFVCRASNNPGIATYPVGSALQQQVIQFAMGGDTTSLTSGRATANRANIMGDIINSSPAILEYKFSDVSSGLTTRLSTMVDSSSRFRLILVGTNQGWLHAFGEVVKNEHATPTDTSTPMIVKGAVDELWSFMPTDFLGYLDQITVSSNPHRFMVDGAPAIYFLDLPPSSGGSGDGVVEVTSSERAMVIFGLGKGGRSYYAIDIHDPYHPVLKWSLVPDEATLVDGAGNPVIASRILDRPGKPTVTTVQQVLKFAGFSTCTPGFGRITLTDNTGKAVVRDAVFFGGGFSVPQVDANFLDAMGKPTPLGRSVLALDAYSGQILAAVNLNANTTTDANGKVLTPGPIYKGVVPFEFILNSGMAQRAYFLDYWGGLWSWGNQKTDPVTTSSTYKYRMDSADLSTWTTDGVATSTPGIRLVAKDESGSLVTLPQYSTTQQYYTEALYTTLPAPFRVGLFQGQAKNTGSPVPATVGIAIESGDRNNPLDYTYTIASKPVHHRLSVVFDRQDSLAWGNVANPIVISPTSTAVMNAYPAGVSYQSGDGAITPGSATYYLAPSSASSTKFGYFRNFSDIDAHTGLIPKGINTPAVVSGSLFYSYFTPTLADPCTGGTGFTYSNLICDAVNPIVADNRTNVGCRSGSKFTFLGVTSDYISLGTRGVIQIGTVAVANPVVGASQTTMDAETITGKTSSQYPKARVWRTVQ